MKLMNIDRCEIQIINPILQTGRVYSNLIIDFFSPAYYSVNLEITELSTSSHLVILFLPFKNYFNESTSNHF